MRFGYTLNGQAATELVVMRDGDANTGFRLGTWLVQPNLNRLSDGDHVAVLEPRVMALLVCLADRPGKIVSADELLHTIWHGRVHSDNTIYQAVTDLRKALGDDSRNPRFIKTISKKGYRLICPITPITADPDLIQGVSPSLSGQQRKRRILAKSAAIALIAIVLFLSVRLQLWSWVDSVKDGPSDRSVAVLPFVDMSENGDQQYLADGIAEELIHVLSNLPDLRVVARTSSFKLRDHTDDVRQIGSKLNVATILEGSIRKDGNRIRVTAQLVNARDGFHLWSLNFDRQSSDIFRIQNEIAVAVANTFKYRDLDVLASDESGARPEELQSYDLYLLGRHELHKNTPSADMRAIRHFEHAIEMDPGFARAYAGLSESYASRYWSERDRELLARAESAAEYALLLDDQSAEAFAAVGRVKISSKDYSAAEAAFAKAIELNRNDVRLHASLARAYEKQGKDEEAFATVRDALKRHPTSFELNLRMGRYYNTLIPRELDKAFEYFNRARDGAPDRPEPYMYFGHYYWSSGQLDQAIPHYKKVIDLTTGPTKAGLFTELLANIYVDLGDFAAAAQLIRQTKELEPSHFGVTNSEIQLQLARGDFAAARDLIHALLPTYIGNRFASRLLAYYEFVIGDTDHAADIYARIAGGSESSGEYNVGRLHSGQELAAGMLGAVNLAYLHRTNGNTRAARELLDRAQKYVESRNDHPSFAGSIPYVLAQIAAIEGNHDVAIERTREAVEAGWSRAWFGQIDPIMKDLRKDARYTQILEDLEEKLSKMREDPKVLASNDP